MHLLPHDNPPPQLVVRIFVALFVCVLAVLFVVQRVSHDDRSRHAIIQLGGETFRATVAQAEADRERGLSGTSSLEKNAAMLFIFEKKDRYPFWMKGMEYAIDIVWVSDGRIIDIAPRVPPALMGDTAYIPHYVPRLAADRVIEVVAGTADRLQLKPGDVVSITP